MRRRNIQTSYKNHLWCSLVIFCHATPHVRLRDYLIDNICRRMIFCSSWKSLRTLSESPIRESCLPTWVSNKTVCQILQNRHKELTPYSINTNSIYCFQWDAVWKYWWISFWGWNWFITENPHFSAYALRERIYRAWIGFIDIYLWFRKRAQKRKLFLKDIDDFDPSRKWRGAGKETTDIESATITIGTSLPIQPPFSIQNFSMSPRCSLSCK